MIIYFSGTGNTRHCARLLSERLGDRLIEMTGSMLTTPSSTRIDTDDERIIWMFPVYSWGIPPIVEAFMTRCTINAPEDSVHHLVMTCGDDAGMTDSQWRKVMRACGYTDRLAFTVIMPNTYVLMKGFDVDAPEVEQAKIDACVPRINEIAERISVDASKVESDVTSGRFPRIKSKVIYPWFIRHCMPVSPFHYTEDCTGCGLCVRSCPMGRITISKHGHPHWTDTCAMCLRCYHVCPHHAVEYVKSNTAGKGQYRRFLK